jgi:hypothetical protein
VTHRLVEPPWRFSGFRTEDFSVFAIRDRETRRREILERFHPELRVLAVELAERLDSEGGSGLHVHLPRLDWPKGYQPFCTWAALSRLAHGYQAGPQLNLGVHADHVSARFAWDTAADAFGRFEFRCRIGGLGAALETIASEEGLAFRVYGSAPWPEGSRVVFLSDADWAGALDAARRHGNWFELGKRWDLSGEGELIRSPALAAEAYRVFSALLPLIDRAASPS